jgi:uncharacterized protein YjbI with pentapeptide repeats
MPSQPNQPPGKSPTRAKRLWSAIKTPFRWTEKRAIEPFANYLDQADIFRIVEKLSPMIEAFGIIAIPIVIWWMTDSGQKAKEDAEKAARAQEDKLEQAARAQEAVKTYLNQLSTVFLAGNLEKDEKLRTVTRASTLALLNDPNLEGTHKGQVIDYLDELNLIHIEPRPTTSQNSKPTEAIISLAKANLSGASLRGVNLSGANLDSANFSGAALNGANLGSAHSKHANFSGAQFAYAHLNSANFFDADFSGANFFDAKLSDTKLRSVSFTGSDLKNANLSGANLNMVSFLGANLSGVNFSGVNLSSTRAFDLSHANLSGANLSSADLSGSDLSDDDLSLTKLCRTTLPPSSKLDPDRDCKELGIPIP